MERTYPYRANFSSRCKKFSKLRGGNFFRGEIFSKKRAALLTKFQSLEVIVFYKTYNIRFSRIFCDILRFSRIFQNFLRSSRIPLQYFLEFSRFFQNFLIFSQKNPRFQGPKSKTVLSKITYTNLMKFSLFKKNSNSNVKVFLKCKSILKMFKYQYLCNKNTISKKMLKIIMLNDFKKRDHETVPFFRKLLF